MIFLVGPYPPPVHGASLITERVAQQLMDENIAIRVANIAPDPGCHGVRYHLSRIRAYFRCWAAIAAHRGAGPTAVYLSLSGGLGLFYDLIVVMLARLKRCDIIVHHHTFHYIVRRSLLLRTIIGIGGATQQHIALCPTMALELARIYGSELKIEIVSNLVFFDVANEGAAAPHPKLREIGYLSTVSFEKGIDRYFDLMATLKARGSRVSGLVAGPFADRRAQDYVERRIRELGNVDYRGPVYGQQKASFFAAIDLLVFPSRLHEAQPLVIFEAQSRGVLAAAVNQGCIAQMRGGAGSLFLLDASDFDFGPLIEQILDWEQSPRDFQDATRQACAEFEDLLRERRAEMAQFRMLFAGYR